MYVRLRLEILLVEHVVIHVWMNSTRNATLSNCFIRDVIKGLYIRSRFTINPDKVYRMAMTKLNTSAGILEVMGAPLSGTDLRAYVMSGGGLTLKKFKPGIRSKRCFLIFPIRGSEKKGLVNVEVKKKNGQVNKFFC